jgi:tetratricopeptide (TPR) repeat protein
MRLGWILASVVLLSLLVALIFIATGDLTDGFSVVNVSDPAEWHNKGDALVNLGKYDEALVCYEKAIDLDPNLAYIWSGKGWALSNLGKYDDALFCYEKAIDLDPNLAYIWSAKGLALESLNRSAEAAMAYSLGRQLELNSETKTGVFATFLIAYSVLAWGGYALTKRHRKYAISIVTLSINLLGFLAMMWILSGFFDLLLIGQFLLGGVVMVAISTAIWSLSGFPANPWINQLVQEIENFDAKCPRFSRFIRAVGFLAVLSYVLMAIIFYFRLHLGSEISMVDFLKIAFGSIFLLGLLVTLPPIWSAMISKNLDGRTRELLLIFQFGHLGLSGLYSGMILWIFGKGNFSHSLSLGDIKFPISIHSLGIVMFLFVLAVIIPYVSGSKRAGKWKTTLFEKERRWLDELVDVLDYPTPNLYVSKLRKVMTEIKGEDTIPGQEEDLDRIKSLYGAEVLRLDPRSRHREFSMKLQEQIAEMIAQFEGTSHEGQTIQERAPIYAEACRLRRDEIIGMIEREGKFKPKFWIILAIILTPVLGQILATLINWILKAMIDTNLGGFIAQTPAFPIPLPLP